MKQPLAEHLRSWFALTDRERFALAAALGLLLAGLAVRHRALRAERPAPAAPPALDPVRNGGSR